MPRCGVFHRVIHRRRGRATAPRVPRAARRATCGPHGGRARVPPFEDRAAARRHPENRVDESVLNRAARRPAHRVMSARPGLLARAEA
ncbi:tetraacyldisaccharide 4'-kinase, partial [Burkholderia pseudomallei]